MPQLTIRGFGGELENRIRVLARTEGISLNQAVLRLLRRGAGLEQENRDDGLIGSDLDELIGSWTDEEAEHFNQAVEDFNVIDEDMWR